MTKVKVCGLFREQDIDYVNEAGADYAGFILNFPKSHRNLTIEYASFLRKRLASGIRAVCVLVNQPPDTVFEIARKVRPDVIQLHGQEGEEYIAGVRAKTGLEIWKAFRVRDDADLTAAGRCIADTIVLDNGYGTGETFDWSKAEEFDRPFILAGGLTPENIPEAVRRMKPRVLDISSGVETDRVKDREKILAAVRAAHTG